MSVGVKKECPVQNTDSSILFVDLDGTLARTDLLHEGIWAAAKQDFVLALRVIYTLIFIGKSRGKQLLAEHVHIDPSRIPLNEHVLSFLEAEYHRKTPIVLATASHHLWANAVAEEVGLFDDVLASDERTNLKGVIKLAEIEKYCQEHDYSEFCYIGDSPSDKSVWQQALNVYVVATSPSFERSIRRQFSVERVFPAYGKRWRDVLRVLRPQQWIKNLLLFAPLCLAHEWTNLPKLLAAGIAFIAFSLCASAVYVINDALDIPADRRHPEKRRRPFASSALPVSWAAPLAVGLVFAALTIAVLLSTVAFVGVLIGYLVLAVFYSFCLKAVMIVDVLVLAGFYTLRIYAGSVATSIVVSEWLLGFSVFFFLSLAFAKRYAELARLENESEGGKTTRGYHIADLSLLASIGPSSGFLAVLIFAFYIRSDAMSNYYSSAWPLWLVCPLLIYWIRRVWCKAKRRELDEDPVLFAIRDRPSWLIGLLVVGLIALSRLI